MVFLEIAFFLQSLDKCDCNFRSIYLSDWQWQVAKVEICTMYKQGVITDYISNVISTYVNNLEKTIVQLGKLDLISVQYKYKTKSKRQGPLLPKQKKFYEDMIIVVVLVVSYDKSAILLDQNLKGADIEDELLQSSYQEHIQKSFYKCYFQILRSAHCLVRT